MFSFLPRHFNRGYLHETGTNSDQTGMSSYRSPYISFHAFTWDRSKNELCMIGLTSSRSLTRHELGGKYMRPGRTQACSNL